MTLLEQAIKQADQLYDTVVGQGDITTENLSTYPRYTVAEIKTTQDIQICGLAILESLMNRGDFSISFQRFVQNGEIIPSSKVIAKVEGNGRSILTGWNVGKPLLSLLSHIYSSVNNIVTDLESSRIGVTHSRNLPIGYEDLLYYAFSSAGGFVYKTRFDENIYLTREHANWVNSLSGAIDFTNREIGENRSLINVIAEITTPEEITAIDTANVNYLYCKGITADNIQAMGEKTKGWAKLIVDETISLENVKKLRDAGVRLYQISINQFFDADDLFSIEFKQ